MQFTRHTTLTLSTLTAAVSAAFALSACGGGGSGGTAAAGGTAGTAAYSGAVTGLGSIVVNGVRFSTTGADTTDADDPSQPFTGAIALGTTVSVTGAVDDASATGQAASIAIEGGVRGSVSAVDTTAKTLVVNGQTVLVNDATVFAGLNGAAFDLSTIAASVNATTPTPVYVEVYGAADVSGTITATRVEQKAGVAAPAIKGSISGLDSANHVFDLTLRTGVVAHVTYADTDVKPVASALVNGAGARVLVNATDAAAIKAATTGAVNVTATKVIVKRDKQADGTKAKLEGAIKTISDNHSTLTIGDVTVDLSQSPTVSGFASAAITDTGIAVGVVVKVKGSFVNGVLVAKSIEADDNERKQAGGGVKLYGAVTSHTASTFVVQGVTVTVATGSTLSVPADGTYVEVLAKPDTAGVLTAVSINTPSATASRPFEVYGITACNAGQSDLTGTAGFTLNLLRGSLAVDGSTATVTTGRNVDLTTAGTYNCLVEVKGTMSTVNSVKTLKASAIQVRLRTTSTLNTSTNPTN